MLNSQKEILKNYVQRIERLQIEQKETYDQIQEVFLEAQKKGLHVQALREVIRLRHMDPLDRIDQEDIVDDYRKILGIL